MISYIKMTGLNKLPKIFVAFLAIFTFPSFAMAHEAYVTDTSFFWQQAIDSLGIKDFVAGLTKPFFFAFFISTISCYYGFTTRGGTTGLGRNTINAVVISCAIILLLDFVAAKIIWEFF